MKDRNYTELFVLCCHALELQGITKQTIIGNFKYKYLLKLNAVEQVAAALKESRET